MGKQRYLKRDRFTRYSTSNYSTVEDVSFCCLKLDNPFRKKVLALVKWRYILSYLMCSCSYHKGVFTLKDIVRQRYFDAT